MKLPPELKTAVRRSFWHWFFRGHRVYMTYDRKSIYCTDCPKKWESKERK